MIHIPGGPPPPKKKKNKTKKNGTKNTEQSIFQLFFSTLLDRASFPHYNNTKIIKFGR